VRANFKPVDPDKARRQMLKDFKAFDKEEPGPERAARLATFTRAAHAERQLNMAMHTAALCLHDDPDAPALLLAAYAPDDDHDFEERLRVHADLADLARYVDQPELREHAEEVLRHDAETWLLGSEKTEWHRIMRTLVSVRDRAWADSVRDRAEFG